MTLQYAAQWAVGMPIGAIISAACVEPPGPIKVLYALSAMAGIFFVAVGALS